MTLAAGSRLGAYEILGALGAGGMGEVYRARDTKLKRDVALKLLPAQFTSDPDRLARFQREAEVLASLNHPNIAHIHGLEDTGTARALVMELVEGEDLAGRLARGPILLDEALPIARQIADALEAAHDQGIIHRDLKPANVKVRPDGTVKVLDFGLAKALESSAQSGPAGASALLANSPTITSPALTMQGMLLGTAAYMSPEQARGRPADKRSDIWAFGCVLYEMLTARRAFDGQDVTDTVANVLKTDPDWSCLPAATPASVQRLLRRCIAREPKQRLAHIADAALELESRADVQERAPKPSGQLRRSFAIAACSAAAAAALTFLAVSPPTTPEGIVTRTVLGMPKQASLFISANERDFVISPDGARVAYVSADGTQLLLRSMDTLEPVVIATGRPRDLFMSPDGAWVGFSDNGGAQLRKVALAGGTPVTLARLGARGPRGAVWTGDHRIIFAATGSPARGLQQVPEDGGEPIALTTPDHSRGETLHLWPSLLPGGRAVLFTVVSGDASRGAASTSIAALDLATGRVTSILPGGSSPRFVPPGYLVYAEGGALRAVRFDPGRLERVGDPVTVVRDLVVKVEGAALFDVAADGTLAYVRTDQGSTGRTATAAWLDRAGRETAHDLPEREYVAPRLSPDGRLLALDGRGADAGIWVFELRRGLRKLTLEQAGRLPVWAPDGRAIAFAAFNDTGGLTIYFQPVATGQPARRLFDGPQSGVPTSFSPDGSHLVFFAVTSAGDRDILMAPVAGGAVSRLVESPADELNGSVSGDGRWLAYESDERGRFDVYVRPFAAGPDARWLVSSDGGSRPMWVRGGRELVYLAPNGFLMSVAMTAVEEGLQPSAPVRLFDTAPYYTGSVVTRTFDAAPDGERFLMLKVKDQARDADVVIVRNWASELGRMLPARP